MRLKSAVEDVAIGTHHAQHTHMDALVPITTLNSASLDVFASSVRLLFEHSDVLVKRLYK